MNAKLAYARLERPNTGSFLTIKLSETVPSLDEVEDFVAKELPGWEVINAYPEDPYNENIANL